MKWFNGITNVEELRKFYKKLLQMHHPDNGGDEEITKQIIKEYDLLFDRLKAQNATAEECNSEDESAQNEAFKAILNEIIGFNMTIEIIGSWIWCFDCYQYKERLKELGFKWSPKKKSWVWHYGKYKKIHKSEISLDDIRAKYGSEKVTNKQKQCVLN